MNTEVKEAHRALMETKGSIAGVFHTLADCSQAKQDVSWQTVDGAAQQLQFQISQLQAIADTLGLVLNSENDGDE